MEDIRQVFPIHDTNVELTTFNSRLHITQLTTKRP